MCAWHGHAVCMLCAWRGHGTSEVCAPRARPPASGAASRTWRAARRARRDTATQARGSARGAGAGRAGGLRAGCLRAAQAARSGSAAPAPRGAGRRVQCRRWRQGRCRGPSAATTRWRRRQLSRRGPAATAVGPSRSFIAASSRRTHGTRPKDTRAQLWPHDTRGIFSASTTFANTTRLRAPFLLIANFVPLFARSRYFGPIAKFRRLLLLARRGCNVWSFARVAA